MGFKLERKLNKGPVEVVASPRLPDHIFSYLAVRSPDFVEK
jgi:hypothetical protein